MSNYLDICNLSFSEITASEELTFELLKLIKGNWPDNKKVPCNRTLQIYYSKLKAMAQKKENENKTFQLRQNAVIHVPQNACHVTQDSLTEEKAVDYLKKKWLREVHFEVLPAKWVEMKEKEAKKAEKPKKTTKKVAEKVEVKEEKEQN